MPLLDYFLWIIYIYSKIKQCDGTRRAWRLAEVLAD